MNLKDVLVDDCDLYLLDKYKWYFGKVGNLDIIITRIDNKTTHLSRKSEKTKQKISDGLKKAYYEHRR